jgi:hypothetical protein
MAEGGMDLDLFEERLWVLVCEASIEKGSREKL